ncbi:type I restriction endonuclease subunit R [Sporomusa malonica]|uniref:Type I restriction enzyme endonuclease subunit n=1 Tax=Sporomusa malonica TaxID=112901 RepID=A0A1W2EXX5_9FIRM|nr:type I restriction endonuclease subunit R [Sporomusa malonica]SMD14524.1 type I restriction enzyme, R subunit [Sporomusa malonica]
MSGLLTEDKLVQETVANYFRDELKWESVYAYNTEMLGAAGTLGRKSEKEVVLERYLRQALTRFNPGLPAEAYYGAVRQLVETMASKLPLQINQEKYELFLNGVKVSFRNAKGKVEERRLKVFDFKTAENNHFLVVRELWVQGSPYRRRPDIIGFVNGIPLLFIELKNVHKDIRRAYDGNFSDYKDTIPHIFHHNALVVLSNGDEGKVGTISSKYEHFHEWKRLEEERLGAVNLETLLKGMCSKENFLDILENFILFDDSSGKLIKILARNHQFLGVNKAVEAVRQRQYKNGQLGVFWHTQGSGKSYSMVLFTRKVHRKLEGNFTFLVITDRDDLDSQIYKTFAGTGAVNDEKCRAAGGKHLRELLREDHPYVFTMIHKFNQEVSPDSPYSTRNDIIVVSDEAHRTQYGRLALNMRNALPNAHYIGFTGTPLFKNDEITKRLFGEYLSTYDFQRAVDDGATVPLYYDSRGEKLGITTEEINEKIAAKLEEAELDADQEARLEKELAREYHIITAGKRLDAIARDFVEHYTTRWETGKAMLVCIDKITAVRMYNLIQFYWQERATALAKQVDTCFDEQEMTFCQRKLAWLKETEIAVVVSEEQGEVQKFRDWDLDIVPHREKMKKGYETADGKRMDMETAFKAPAHPFRVAIVCAMWLTGFDVPSLATLYLDKPLKAHTLMQTIARANRVYEGKNNGLIVDYCGILKQLRQALATFAVGGDTGGGGIVPVKPDEELLGELAEAIDLVRVYLTEQGTSLLAVMKKNGFEKIAAINQVKDSINQNDESRKRFEVLAREVFKKFKACLTINAVNKYQEAYAAIDIVYKKLREGRDKADISDILRQLQGIVDEAVQPAGIREEDSKLYDISHIDFDLLRKEFKKVKHKNTLVQDLKEAIEKRLAYMLQCNPGRIDFCDKYQKIIDEYNKEKDRATIEATFEAIMKFCADLDDEDKRGVREGLDDEHLALFDLLVSGKDLTPQQRNGIKQVGALLLKRLKDEKLRVEHWRDKETAKAAVKTYIYDFLYDEKTGLPTDSFTEEDVQVKAWMIYEHIYQQYPDLDHSVYAGYGQYA